MVWIVIVLILVIATFIIVRAPKGWLALIKKYFIRTIAAVLMIAMTNIIGNTFGIHIPINVFTVCMTSMLGIPGLLTVTSLQLLLF